MKHHLISQRHLKHYKHSWSALSHLQRVIMSTSCEIKLKAQSHASWGAYWWQGLRGLRFKFLNHKAKVIMHTLKLHSFCTFLIAITWRFIISTYCIRYTIQPTNKCAKLLLRGKEVETKRSNSTIFHFWKGLPFCSSDKSWNSYLICSQIVNKKTNKVVFATK